MECKRNNTIWPKRVINQRHQDMYNATIWTIEELEVLLMELQLRKLTLRWILVLCDRRCTNWCTNRVQGSGGFERKALHSRTAKHLIPNRLQGLRNSTPHSPNWPLLSHAHLLPDDARNLQDSGEKLVKWSYLKLRKRVREVDSPIRRNESPVQKR